MVAAANAVSRAMVEPGRQIGLLGGQVGGGELLLLFLVVLVLFGAERLPETARRLGRVTAMLQRAARDFWRELAESSEGRGADRPGPEEMGRGEQGEEDRLR